ncbi:hypothetical protein BKE38_12445 [Pseudoroseomonas deserti]|uniref:Uncharacterized protein n=1 Tax=Teichococcus deserti TaxID=1817963 RepID=A0A1V2H2G4_9PROT|nr:hypothetical protein [Pseudoroseomonas deserti]ONG53329.1 hypothetical protein BKE38_12445 [Pseudoroseomonas deserti]
MLDEVEESLREMLCWAGRRAAAVPPEMAPIVGEVAAETWRRRHVPAAPEARARWLKASRAVLSLLPDGPAEAPGFGRGSLPALRAARAMVGVIIDQQMACGTAAGRMAGERPQAAEPCCRCDPCQSAAVRAPATASPVAPA